MAKRLNATAFVPLATEKDVGGFATTTELFEALEKGELV